MSIDYLIRTVLVALVFGQVANVVTADSGVNFNRDIRPILANHCYACHGPDGETREADLRLDTFEGATADLGGHVAIKAGSPDESELIARIESNDPDSIMPPIDGGQPLDDEQKELLRQWIADGGGYDRHWSFTPPTKSALPAVNQQAWPRHPIDYFVLRRLERAELTPAPEADRYQWLRRVSLDITGLPPTLKQTDEFVADPSDNAFSNVVDRLLDSEAFGEKWARMWLDLARYADTKGYEKDQPREIWMYRQWVIEALNDDMPFDQFTVEQLAGDLLPDPTNNQLVATAFHRNTMTNDEGGTDDEEFRVAAVKDRVDTTVQVWMGLTMGCAKCHSHKYDPITQQDYYKFYALFNQTQDADRGDDAPTIASPSKEQAADIAKLENQIQSLTEQLNKESTEPKQANEAVQKALTDLESELRKLRKQAPRTPIMRELAADKQRQTHIHTRGNFLDQGDPVTPSVIESFGDLPADAQPNRLGVARWLMQSDNPLTAGGRQSHLGQTIWYRLG